MLPESKVRELSASLPQLDLARRVALIRREIDGQVIKLNPLLDWSRERVAAYVRDHGIPINLLHSQGFVSIGCAPCTRAVAPG